uniref:Uncharacterized protein n=1 Tax=Amphimedon queenslandica TaxID=400682 RepID=A0A1X7VHS9_AMPQE
MNDSHKCEFLMRKIILEILLPYLTKFQDKNILGCDEPKLSCLKLLLSSLQIALNFFVNLPSSCWLRKLCYGTKLCRTMCLNLQNMKCLTCRTLVDYDEENNYNLFFGFNNNSKSFKINNE